MSIQIELPLPIGYGFVWEQVFGSNSVEEIIGYVYKGEPAQLYFMTKSGISPRVGHPSIVCYLSPQEIKEKRKEI